MTNPLDQSPKLFLLRSISGKKYTLRDVVNHDTYALSNEKDTNGGQRRRIEIHGEDLEILYDFSVPTGAFPVYIFLGTWESVLHFIQNENFFNVRTESDSVASLMVGEFPSDFFNKPEGAQLFLNCDSTRDPYGEMSLRILLKDNSLVPFFNLMSLNLVDELARRLTTSPEGSPIIRDSNRGWYYEGYIIDQEKSIKLSKLPEAIVFAQTKEGIVPKWHQRKGEVLVSDIEGRPTKGKEGNF